VTIFATAAAYSLDIGVATLAIVDRGPNHRLLRGSDIAFALTVVPSGRVGVANLKAAIWWLFQLCEVAQPRLRTCGSRCAQFSFGRA
jgi:hypothetical protein